MPDPYWTSEGRDAYEILGVDRTASQAEIRQAFRRLSRVHHPDAGGQGDEQSRLNLAYHTLSDPQRRAAYDRGQPARPATPPPDADLQWRSGTGPTDPPRPGRDRPPEPPPEPARTEPARTEPATNPGAPAPPEPDVGPILTAFLLPSLLLGIVQTIFVGYTMSWSFGVIVLMSLTLVFGIFVFVIAAPHHPPPPAVAVAAGLALVAGLLSGLAGAVVISLRSDANAGVMVVVLAGAFAPAWAYGGMASSLSRFGDRMAAVAWYSGLLLFTLLAGFVAAVAWVGELSGWHAGVIWLMWTGFLLTAISCAVAVSTASRRGRPRWGRLVTGSLVPVGVFGAGTTFTVWFGMASGWPTGGISLCWALVAAMNLSYLGVRTTLATDA